VASKLDSAFFGKGRRPPGALEKPFRDELLSVEHLDERARSLAGRFTVDPRRRAARNIFPRFDENGHHLREAYRTLAGDVHRGEFVTSAGPRDPRRRRDRTFLGRVSAPAPVQPRPTAAAVR